MARVNGDPKYKSYSNGYQPDQPVEELQQFQEYLSDYKIMVYDGLSPDRLIFSGNSFSEKKLYLLHDAETGHYNVITNIKAAMVKMFICNACDTLYDKT
jgi:hypothetical protein